MSENRTLGARRVAALVLALTLIPGIGLPSVEPPRRRGAKSYRAWARRRRRPTCGSWATRYA